MTEPFDETTAQELSEVIRRNSQPLAPEPTGVTPRLDRLEGICAVVFDVYGTLLVSGSGDVGTTDVASRPQAFREALHAVGVPFAGSCEEGVRLLTETIAAHHVRDKQRGIEFPEVDIREVWADVLNRLAVDGLLGEEDGNLKLATRLALEYEVRTNPLWPMPNAVGTLHALRDASSTLGIVSNAQVFTRLLFPSLLGHSLDEFGFDPGLCAWSYAHHQAKPGTFLYELVRRGIEKQGISAREVLFVGNDMLKDVWPANRVGFRTALFAGDARSYRPRTEDARVSGMRPDLVLTNLAQLPECVLTK